MSLSDDISIYELNKQTKKELDFQVKESKRCKDCKSSCNGLCKGHETRIKLLEESIEKSRCKTYQKYSKCIGQHGKCSRCWRIRNDRK